MQTVSANSINEYMYILSLGILGVKGINRNDPPFIFTFNLLSINFHFHFNIPGRARDIYQGRRHRGCPGCPDTHCVLFYHIVQYISLHKRIPTFREIPLRTPTADKTWRRPCIYIYIYIYSLIELIFRVISIITVRQTYLEMLSTIQLINVSSVRQPHSASKRCALVQYRDKFILRHLYHTNFNIICSKFSCWRIYLYIHSDNVHNRPYIIDYRDSIFKTNHLWLFSIQFMISLYLPIS